MYPRVIDRIKRRHQRQVCSAKLNPSPSICGSIQLKEVTLPLGGSGTQVTGEGKAVSFLTLKNINENHFWSPKALAYRRKTYPPRACHLAVTARPSQREGGFICSQSPTKFREEPPLRGAENSLANWTGRVLRILVVQVY